MCKLLSPCQEKTRHDLFMLSLSPSFYGKIFELMCWLGSAVSWPGHPLGRWRVRTAENISGCRPCSLDNLSYSKLWISPALAIEPPAIERCEQQRTRMRVLKKGMQPKSLFLCQSYREVQTATSCPKREKVDTEKLNPFQKEF